MKPEACIVASITLETIFEVPAATKRTRELNTVKMTCIASALITGFATAEGIVKMTPREIERSEKLAPSNDLGDVDSA